MQVSRVLIILIIGLLLKSPEISGQSKINGVPEGLRNKNILISTTIELYDSSSNINDDAISKRNIHLKSLQVANNINVYISPKNDGFWQNVGNKRIWTCLIRSKNALAIGLIMDNISLKEQNNYLFITITRF